MDDNSISANVTQARERYEKDQRFRVIAQSVAARVMQDHLRERGQIDPDCAEEEAGDIALKVAVIMLETIFQNDAELNAQREMADRYRSIAESTVRLSVKPPPILLARA